MNYSDLELRDQSRNIEDEVQAGLAEYKARRKSRVTQVQLNEVKEARAKVGLTQGDFAALMGVSVRTLQEWEQDRREPNKAAKTLVKIALVHPEVLREVNETCPA